MPLQTQSATVGAGGTATVLFQQVNSALTWIVTQIAVFETVNGVRIVDTAVCSVTLDDLPQFSTASGSGDTASGDPPIYMSSGDYLKATWTGATVGALVTAVITYGEYPTSQIPAAYGGTA